MRQHELFEARPVLRIQHVRAFPLVISTHGQKPPEGAFYSQFPLGCDEQAKWLVSGPSGNNWRSRLVCTNETRPICGAGSLDSRPRRPPRKLAGRSDLNVALIVLTLVASFSLSGTPNSPGAGLESRTMRSPEGMPRSGGVAVFTGFYFPPAAGRNLLAEKFQIKRYKFWKATVLLVGRWFFSLEWPPMPVVR